MRISTTRLPRLAGWILALAIVFLSLGPVEDRPQTGHPQAERFAAYALLGAVLSLSYPKHRGWIAVGLLVGVTALELGQMAVTGRDARARDAVAKMMGGIVGVTTAGAAAELYVRRGLVMGTSRAGARKE